MPVCLMLTPQIEKDILLKLLPWEYSISTFLEDNRVTPRSNGNAMIKQ